VAKCFGREFPRGIRTPGTIRARLVPMSLSSAGDGDHLVIVSGGADVDNFRFGFIRQFRCPNRSASFSDQDRLIRIVMTLPGSAENTKLPTAQKIVLSMDALPRQKWPLLLLHSQQLLDRFS
jgi:hypothetical protein